MPFVEQCFLVSLFFCKTMLVSLRNSLSLIFKPLLNIGWNYHILWKKYISVVSLPNMVFNEAPFEPSGINIGPEALVLKKIHYRRCY